MSAWTLCIDFGTAFSKAAAAPRNAWSRFDPGSIRPLPLGGVQEAGNPFLLDSAVFIDDQQILFGRAAIARAEALAHKKRAALRSFKTVLSASDLDRTLATNAAGSVDPHRMFQMRDLVVLYLAYLLSAIDRAASADQVLQRADGIDRRYALPAWRGVDTIAMRTAISGLFGEAEAFRRAVGDALLDADGIAIERVSELLPRAQQQPAPYDLELIFEAPAAAAYTSIGLDGGGSHFIVVDMGAGTTDIAALARDDERLVELAEARMTLKHAGDFVDRVIANAVLDGSRIKGSAQQTELWRALMLQMRDLKEAMFATGKASMRHQGKIYTVQLKQLEKSRDFKDFLKALTAAYENSLAIAAADAVVHGRGAIQAVAVGGGASAPFIQKLIRTKPRGGKVKVAPRPATPQWAHGPEFQGNLAPVFPQLAIAIGGALAPESMLAARGLNPRAPA